MAARIFKGAEYLVTETSKDEIFTPDDFSDEQREIGRTTEQFDHLFSGLEVDARQGADFAEDALAVVVHLGDGRLAVLDLLAGQTGNILV